MKKMIAQLCLIMICYVRCHIFQEPQGRENGILTTSVAGKVVGSFEKKHI